MVFDDPAYAKLGLVISTYEVCATVHAFYFGRQETGVVEVYSVIAAWAYYGHGRSFPAFTVASSMGNEVEAFVIRGIHFWICFHKVCESHKVFIGLSESRAYFTSKRFTRLFFCHGYCDLSICLRFAHVTCQTFEC